MGATLVAPGCASFFRVVVVNGLRDDITCGIQAGNLRQRGLRPLVGDQCRQLLRLRIVFRLQANLVTTLYCINVPKPQLSEARPIPPACRRNAIA